jgi:hypothetical protein
MLVATKSFSTMLSLTEMLSTSRAYTAYISSSHGSLDGFPLYERQRAIAAASKKVDNLTGRKFFPTHSSVRHTMREKSFTVFLFEPIIGISGVTIESNGVVVGTYTDSDIILGLPLNI